MFNEHETGLSHSKDLYEMSINTPLLIYAPNIKANRITQTVASIDIMPTILDLLGTNIPKQAEGLSLERLMLGSNNINYDRPIVSELGGGTRAETLLMDEWKLMLNYERGRPPQELYNLQNDPDENKNLVNESSEIAEKLQDALNTHKERRKKYPQKDYDFPEWIDKETRQRLIKEGYF